jgi:hypothetical protein
MHSWHRPRCEGPTAAPVLPGTSGLGRVRCPYCDKQIKLTTTGRMRVHCVAAAQQLRLFKAEGHGHAA